MTATILTAIDLFFSDKRASKPRSLKSFLQKFPKLDSFKAGSWAFVSAAEENNMMIMVYLIKTFPKLKRSHKIIGDILVRCTHKRPFPVFVFLFGMYDQWSAALKVELCTNTAIYGRPDILDFMLSSKGEKLDILALEECIMDACETGCIETVEFLLKKGYPVNRDTSAGTLLCRACSSTGSLSTIQLLLDNGADPNQKQYDGSSPLERLCDSDDVYYFQEDAVKLLVEKGANVNSISDNGSLLTSVFRHQNKELLEYLLSKGARSSLCAEEYYQIPLIIGISDGWQEGVRLLLDADPKCMMMMDDINPLYDAFMKRDTEIAELLIRKGCNVKHVHKRQSALDVAIQEDFCDNESFMKLIIDKTDLIKPRSRKKLESVSQDLYAYFILKPNVVRQCRLKRIWHLAKLIFPLISRKRKHDMFFDNLKRVFKHVLKEILGSLLPTAFFELVQTPQYFKSSLRFHIFLAEKFPLEH